MTTFIEQDHPANGDDSLLQQPSQANDEQPSRENEEQVEDFFAGEDEPLRDLEIVGLNAASNGRTCKMHAVCGTNVNVGDILRLQKTVITNDEGLTEEAVACISVVVGVERCRVAFLPRFLIRSPMIRDNINKHVQVTELYKDSTSTTKRRLSHSNSGMAAAVFLSEVPQDE